MEALVPDIPLYEMPWTFTYILERASYLKSFFKLTSDDRPPRKIWTDDEALADWFYRLEQNKSRKSPANNSNNLLYRKEL